MCINDKMNEQAETILFFQNAIEEVIASDEGDYFYFQSLELLLSEKMEMFEREHNISYNEWTSKQDRSVLCLQG